VPAFLDAVSVALIETSPVMVAAQRSALREARVPVSWYATLDELPDGPLIVLANEFIDALPIRQFIYRDGAWRERLIESDGSGGFYFTEGDRLKLGAQAGDLPDSAPDGSILETRPAARTLLRELARRAALAPLAALISDYGHDEAGFGDTLQAVRGHRFAATLADPGSADLSAHVDFADLKRQASALGLKPYGPVPQGEFLLKLGLGERRNRLLQRATPEQAEAIASGASRLVDPKQMGILFKALALTGADLPPPPPFGPQHLTVSY
jgi:NADH dehydrogenase [ubiquinone] 1 alpha subcomplex assembly factor 7